MALTRKTVGFLAAAGLLTLSGCAGGASSTEANPTITYWASQGGATVEITQEALEPVIEAFTEETGIEVNLEVISWADLNTRIMTAISSGDVPDVTDIGNTWSVGMQETGAFVEFDDAAYDAIGGSDKFVQSLLTATAAADTVPQTVPLYAQTYSLYYNTEMFAAAGLETPATDWEGFLEDAEALTLDTDGDGAIDQWGLGIAGAAARNSSHFTWTLAQQLGGDYFDEDGTPTFTDDAVVEGAQEYIDLMSEAQVVAPSDSEVQSINDSVQDFINGEIAMMIVQSPRAALDAAGFTTWAVADVPVVDGGEPVESPVLGTNISVFRDGNTEAGLQLVSYLTSPEVQASLTAAYSSLPVVTEAYDSEQLASDATIPVRQRILAENTRPYPLYSRAGEAETLVGGAVSTLLAQYATSGTSITESDIRAALETAQQSMNAAG